MTEGDYVKFRVDGIPIQQGSKTLVRRGSKAWMIDANISKLKPWREKVAAAADCGVTFDCPVSVHMLLHMPMPNRPKFRRPATKPDADKLARAINDSLTAGGLISDDSRIVELHVIEEYSELPGVTVTVREVQ